MRPGGLMNNFLDTPGAGTTGRAPKSKPNMIRRT